MKMSKYVTIPMGIALLAGIVLTIYKPGIQVQVASMLGKVPADGGGVA